MTQKIERTALVMHSAERMFTLVNNVAAYPEFLPWCVNARVHHMDAKEVLASLEIEKGAVRHQFTTRNRLEAPEVIRMELVDGPFRRLTGAWSFAPLGDSASKVSLALNFELSGVLSRMVLGAAFSEAINSMVDAFCRRADDVYGKPALSFA